MIRMIKRFILCLVVCFLLLPSGAALADTIMGNDFFYSNQNETRAQYRSFRVNGADGYVSVLIEPDSKSDITRLKNGVEIWIERTYFHEERYWGYVGSPSHGAHLNGWVPMDELLFLYSHSDFIGEHLLELHTYTDNGGIRRVLESEMQYIWRWPGSDMGKLQVNLAYVVGNHFTKYLYDYSPFGEYNVYEYLNGNIDELPYSYLDYISDHLYGNPGDNPDNYFDFLHEYHNYLYNNYFETYCETNGLEIPGESIDNAEDTIVRMFYEAYGEEHYHEFFDHFYENFIDYKYEEICRSFVARYAYMDDEGREWVFFDIEDGWGRRRYVDGWICVDDPANADIPPFKPAPDPIPWSPTEAPDWYGVREPSINDNGEDNEFELGMPLIIIASVVLIGATIMVIYVFRKPKRMK